MKKLFLTFIFFINFISTQAFAGACMEEDSFFKQCLEAPQTCKAFDYYRINSNQTPVWFKALNPSVQKTLNPFISALSCYPINQWNLGTGLYGLKRKAEDLEKLRKDQTTRSFLEKNLIPQVKTFPELSKNHVVRYYLSALKSPLIKNMSLRERAWAQDPKALQEIKIKINKSNKSQQCDLLSYAFFIDPKMAIDLSKKHQLNCYQSPQETIRLLERIYPEVSRYSLYFIGLRQSSTRIE